MSKISKKPRAGQDYRSTTLRLRKELDKKFDLKSREFGVPKAQMARMLIERYVDGDIELKLVHTLGV